MSQVNKSVEQNAETPVGVIPSSPTAAAAGMDEDHEVVQSKQRPPPSPDPEIVLGGGDPNGSNPGTDDDRSTVRPHSGGEPFHNFLALLPVHPQPRVADPSAPTKQPRAAVPGVPTAPRSGKKLSSGPLQLH